MKVLVAGSTGETGRRIVKELVNRQIPVKALVRDSDKARTILPEAAELIVGDILKPETLKGAMADCTAVLCATGAAPSFNFTGPYQVDYQGTKNLVDAAKASGIDRFVLVSSLCVSQLFHPLNLFWLILVWKQQGEKYIQQSGLDYTIVRPGADTLFDGSIPRQKVAQTCVEALFQPAASRKTVEIVAKSEAPEVGWGDLFSRVTATG
jgi:uncharacterized protein YbjT (DUF2867 family)